jgi:hypothetical protein
VSRLASGQGKNYLPSLEGRRLRGGWEYANDPHLTSPLKGEEVLWNLLEYFTRTLDPQHPLGISSFDIGISDFLIRLASEEAGRRGSMKAGQGLDLRGLQGFALLTVLV